MTRTRRVALAMVLALAAVETGSAQKADPQQCGPFGASSDPGQGGSRGRRLGDGVDASLLYARAGGHTFGFVVVYRGLRSGSSGGGETVGGATEQTRGYVTAGERRVVDYDIGPDSVIARLGGVRADLHDGNVLLADFLADETRPPAVSVVGCVDITEDNALTTVGFMPAVKAFVGPGGRTNRAVFGFADLITSGRLVAALAIAALVLVVVSRRAPDTPTVAQPEKAPRFAFGLAVALAVGAAIVLIPVVRGHGPLLVLLFPVALAVFPMALPQTRARALLCALAGMLMTGFCIIGVMSIGVFFVPAALMLLIAALVGLISTRPARR